MYCHKCGAEVDNEDLFCPKCGCRLEPQTRGGENNTVCYAPDYKKAPQPKKPIYKKWWFWVLVLIVVGNAVEKVPEATRARNQREAAQVLAERSQQQQVQTPVEEDSGYTEEEQAEAARAYYEKIGYDPTQEPELPEVEDDGISVIEPVVANSGNGYSGNGDDYFEIAPLDELWYMEITGNAASNHFAVKGYDASGDYTELFVNTLEPYSGSVLDPEQSTRMLEVTSSGDWTVRLKPLSGAPVLTTNETYSGSGDAVLLVPTGCTSAKITGNSASHHFAVKGYGDYYNLLVNTIDPYAGTVRLERNTVVLTVTAEGSWQITVS